MRLLRFSWLRATLITLATTACIIVGPFDPTGTDGTATFDWTIDGVAPTTTACAGLAAAGDPAVTRVRIRLFESVGGEAYVTLSQPCESGSIGPIGLRRGTYFARLEGLDDTGSVRVYAPSSTETAMIRIDNNDHTETFALGNVVPSPGLRVDLSFEDTPGGNTFSPCATNAVSTYEYAIIDAANVELATSDAPVTCSATTTMSDIPLDTLAVDQQYTLRVTGLDAASSVRWTQDCLVDAIDLSTRIGPQSCQVRQIATSAIVTVNLHWQFNGSSYGTCAQTGENPPFDWKFVPAGMPAAGTFTSSANCEDTLSVDFDFGTYDLVLFSTNAAGTKWGEAGACQNVIIDASTTTIDCDISVVP